MITNMSQGAEQVQLPKVGLETKTQEYWTLSSAWQGRYNPKDLRMGELCTLSLVLTKDAASIPAPRLADVACTLYNDTVLMKRCRKTKSPNNLVALTEARERKQIRQARRMEGSVGSQAPAMTTAPVPIAAIAAQVL